MSGFSRLSRAAAVLAMAAVSAPLVAQQCGAPLDSPAGRVSRGGIAAPRATGWGRLPECQVDPLVYYAGAVSGVVFKTTDGGPLVGDLRRPAVSSIGFIAVAPSDPNVVYVGTGEPNIRSNISLGWGVYKSTDAGKTWAKVGLDQTGRSRASRSTPGTPMSSFVSAVAMPTAPRKSAVYSGPWMAEDVGTGAVRGREHRSQRRRVDPSNPRIVYATTWQLVIPYLGRKSGGPGSGIWKSTDVGPLGVGSPATDCRQSPLASRTCRWRRRTRTGSTP